MTKIFVSALAAEGKQTYRLTYTLNGTEENHTTVEVQTNSECGSWSDDFRNKVDDSAMHCLDRSVVDFHTSRATMMVHQESISAVLPGGKSAVLVQKKLSPLSITANGSKDGKSLYRVQVAVNESRDEYTFEVDNGEIPVVSWEHRFWLDCGGSVERATPLLNSVLALYKSTK